MERTHSIIPALKTFFWVLGAVLVVSSLGAWTIVSAAITRDATAVQDTEAPTLTQTYTIGAAADPWLSVCVRAASTDLITGVTYRGAALTQIKKQQNNNGLGRWLYVYGGAATSSGAGDIIVTSIAADDIAINAVAYYGVSSTSVGTSTAPTANITALTVYSTTTYDGSWLTGCVYGDGDATGVTGGTHTDLVSNQAVNNRQFDDEGNAVTAGTWDLNYTMQSGHWSSVQYGLYPTVEEEEETPTSTTDSSNIELGSDILFALCVVILLLTGWSGYKLSSKLI